MKEKARMFISYSHTNKDQCVLIAEVIGRTELFEIWYDKGLISCCGHTGKKFSRDRR